MVETMTTEYEVFQAGADAYADVLRRWINEDGGGWWPGFLGDATLRPEYEKWKDRGNDD